MKCIHDRSPVPIVADECVFDHHDAFRILADDAVDYVNLNSPRAAELRGAEGGIGRRCRGQVLHDRLHDGIAARFAAAAHLASSMNHFRFFDLDSANLLAETPLLGGCDMRKTGGAGRIAGIGGGGGGEFLEKCRATTV